MKKFDWCTFGENEGEQFSILANKKEYTKDEFIKLIYDKSWLLTTDDFYEKIKPEHIQETYICKSQDEDYEWEYADGNRKNHIKCWEFNKENVNF